MKHRVAYHATIAAKGTEVVVSPQMVARWKPPQSIAHLGESGFPVHLFDVNGCDRQLMTPLQTTTFEDIATIFRQHPLTKPMHPLTAADLWLISALGSHTRIQSCLR
jgi:hypothetical protein